MRPSAIISILAPVALALPATLVSRAEDLAPRVLTQISALNEALGGLTTAVNNFDGTLLGVLPQSLAVIGAETKLDATTVKTTLIVNRSSNFTDAESQEVVGALAGLIGPIQTSLDVLKAKYPLFKKTLESPIVLLDLKILKKHTDQLIDAVTKKVTEPNVGLLGLGKGIIDQAFDDAINVYKGN
ncbi:hypothetical protein BU24DRAFT_410107 [Aaosphaeria arxii CBS 175.79]|uniref:Antigenic cell wall galactomanno protein n=1 Tax=Aaosphaeria arxii CBS 175.79 TaxID=1450172 RepID=A0A6A5XN83_9PLEO|nr:uncharacterized protein BU24DRAFT_410107 [Aaosphaeria arxii CBS 175.79]KAF2014356.1 hypothetical protein BU24DRAFT_410107 [Aaosphaeria arxii CBS 175.79]